jgi:ADP-ribose pyrophosphatase
MMDSEISEMVEVVRQQTAYAGRVLHVVDELLRFPSGDLYPHVTVRHPGAVVILPCEGNGKLVAIRQYRHAVRQTLLEFPAGTLEPLEQPMVCARRELAEEVGRRAKAWQDLGQLLPAPGFCNEIQYCYYASDLTPCEPNLDDDELIEVVTLSPTEIETAIRDGRMKDGKSISIFMRAKLFGLL